MTASVVRAPTWKAAGIPAVVRVARLVTTGAEASAPARPAVPARGSGQSQPLCHTDRRRTSFHPARRARPQGARRAVRRTTIERTRARSGVHREGGATSSKAANSLPGRRPLVRPLTSLRTRRSRESAGSSSREDWDVVIEVDLLRPRARGSAPRGRAARAVCTGSAMLSNPATARRRNAIDSSRTMRERPFRPRFLQTIPTARFSLASS
jgi:hypothetical protein